jgi:hypothetical protein
MLPGDNSMTVLGYSDEFPGAETIPAAAYQHVKNTRQNNAFQCPFNKLLPVSRKVVSVIPMTNLAIVINTILQHPYSVAHP